jgi:poly-beta-1,6-N-acetyl-D-glucosamine synthase
MDTLALTAASGTLLMQGMLDVSIESAALFLLAYPFVTCLLWSGSGLFYLLRHNQGQAARGPHALPQYSVVIPFHAEPDAALASMRSLAGVIPAPAEIVLVDDGSPKPISATEILPPSVRVVRMAKNRGKAGALQQVLPGLRTGLVVCMDADTLSESSDWAPMLAAFEDPSLGAVTGKIRPAAGGGLVEHFQALDYLTVIAVIKAAESAWGGLLTVSGAFTAYRVSALRSIGGWNTESSTEDIDASWRLQAHGWRLAFEMDWTARVEMAPNLAALWRQRRRWSAGLGRALRDHGAASLFGGARHLPIIVLTLSSLAWSTAILFLVIRAMISWQGATAGGEAIDLGEIGGLVAAGVAAFYVQLATALAVDGGRLGGHWRSVLLAPLYPIYFWGLLMSSFLAGFPKGFLRRDNGRWSRTVRRIEARAA